VDAELLEERDRLLALHAERPDDPRLNFRCAVVHDRLGLEHEAVPFYLRALEGGLDDEDLQSAYLGLGSTYRAIGEYEKAVSTLTRGQEAFPEAEEMTVFKAMALYNLGRAREAVSLLLGIIARTSDNPGVNRYRRAIDFYAERLDDTW
jgi:tetratricopeptide (TPR) repeat protein